MKYFINDIVNSEARVMTITSNNMVNISWGGQLNLEENKEKYRIGLV